MSHLQVVPPIPLGRPEIEIRTPAEGGYLSVVRTASAALAARLDFTIDLIEDLRIAVDEACEILLTRARPGSELYCRFDVVGDSVVVSARATTDHLQAPARHGFAWTVLSALATAVDIEVVTENGSRELVITLTQTPTQAGSQ